MNPRKINFEDEVESQVEAEQVMESQHDKQKRVQKIPTIRFENMEAQSRGSNVHKKPRLREASETPEAVGFSKL